jgi:S1-C subfamily serine protease
MNHHSSSAARAVLIGALVLVLGAAVGFAQSTLGILVSDVQSGSPAEKAGIARGDIILEANAAAVNTAVALQKAINAKKPGDTLALKLRHGDTEKTVNVVLGSQAGRTWIGIALADGRGMGRSRGMGRGMGRGFAARAQGALVASVGSGSPAEKAGLKQGDLILSVDGVKLDGQNELANVIAQKKVGAVVTLSVQSPAQDGTQPSARDVKVTLAKHPDKDAPYLGVQYSMGAPWFGQTPMMPGIASGVLVAEVSADGPAAKAGITSRDIITKVDGANVSDAQQVVDAVAKHAPGDTVKITVYRPGDGTMKDYTVTLGKNPQDAAKAWMGISMSSLDRQMGPRQPRQPGEPRQPRQPSAGPVGPGI